MSIKNTWSDLIDHLATRMETNPKYLNELKELKVPVNSKTEELLTKYICSVKILNYMRDIEEFLNYPDLDISNFSEDYATSTADLYALHFIKNINDPVPYCDPSWVDALVERHWQTRMPMTKGDKGRNLLFLIRVSFPSPQLKKEDETSL